MDHRFRGRLRDLGWIEDRTIAIAYRWAEGHPERYAEIAVEFVRLNVNVIVTTGPAAPQAKKATSVIPIVLALSGDPVGAGLCDSSATRQQHHWPVDAVARYCRQATRTLARGCPQFSPVGDHGQCRLSRMPCWMRARLRRRLNRSASKSPRSKSGERGISCPLLIAERPRGCTLCHGRRTP